MSAALPAFMAEAVFYLAAGFEETRAWFAMIGSKRAQAGLLWISALIPYLIFSFSTGTFLRNAFYLLAALTAIFAFWYAVAPRRWAYDIGFLVIAGYPVLARIFGRIYRSPDPHIRGADILGHLMWIRVGIMALLVLREWDPGAFTFWPRAREWKIGTVCYCGAIIPIIALALSLHDVTYGLRTGEWWKIGAYGIGTFFAFLWVVAFGEELFFRGVVERAMLDNWNSRVAAVALASVIFGAAHLWFHQFPNWRRALVATFLGIACGIAYLRSNSVRAPMVTHALVVATWRMFFV